MLYQSTGEVRAPRNGEYYLTQYDNRRVVLASMDGPYGCSCIIMEPVEEFVEPELERARRAHGD